MTTCPFTVIADGPIDVAQTDGPVLVRHARSVRDDQGVVHPVSRPVVGLCACGLTQRSPWCDGTHKVAVPRA